MKAVVFDQGIIAKDLPPKEINKDLLLYTLALFS